MKFLIDTNICSAHMERPGRFSHRLIQYYGQLAIPSLVLAELYSGAFKQTLKKPRLLELIDQLRLEFHILPFDEECAFKFGEIRGPLLRRGIVRPAVDLMIASVALVHDLTLVTHNVRDFDDVPGLNVEDWLQP